MNKILLHNPGIGTLNIGDQIISDSAKKQLSSLLKQSFVSEISTHMPNSYYYMRLFRDMDFSFVLGSNLLKSTKFGFKRQWDVKLSQFYLNPAILVGVGWWQYGNKPNLYTKMLYKKRLSSQFLHSVRDEYTLKILKDMGIKNVVNTSCATMWGFTEEYNYRIPQYKSNNVVFTLTDYNKNEVLDKQLIDLLINNYRNVYFWPQGTGDLNYIISLMGDEIDRIEFIEPNLNSYDNILKQQDIDFIGTRLHGGIRALQNERRTLILSVDNRAEEKKKDFNLPVVSRNSIGEIQNFIENKFITQITTPQKDILLWKNQFGVK
ncbi:MULTISPECIES: polysaccharide pyruvyl transferase family protein [Enterococcus]|uniref:polysaccharide pyruvyl transferase family protein n=1 Tax=Enterococcus TaxID=1350 RepID=UPI0010FF9D38|nr:MULTISPECIES: polysaccharide pyruvyl transferase family protein [Enterococcus]QCT93188.1 polysaccharide pyruvyl transferase family protein [Enterococcus sp. M190262]GMG57301.1 hypothetical protein AH4_07240 [Enterococcus gallinarum]